MVIVKNKKKVLSLPKNPALSLSGFKTLSTNILAQPPNALRHLRKLVNAYFCLQLNSEPAYSNMNLLVCVQRPYKLT